MNLIKEITLDLAHRQGGDIIRFHQGDINSASIKVTLLNKSLPYSVNDMTIKYDATINGYLAEEDADGTVSGNVITIPITANMTALAGKLLIDIKIIDTIEENNETTETVLITQTVEALVDRSVINGDTIIDISGTTIAGKFAEIDDDISALEAKFPIHTDDIAPGAVKTNQLGLKVVNSSKIDDGAITTAKIDDGAITNDKMAHASVGNNQLIELSVATSNIADGAVTTDKLAGTSVNTSKLADGAVTSGKLAYHAVTYDKIEPNAIATGNIADGAVTNAKISTGAVTTDKIGSEQVTESKIDSSVLNKPMQPAVAVTTSNYSDYSDANDFTPNRIYAIYPDITAQMVANLPVYGAVGHLMYYTCGAAVKSGIQIYCTRDEMWFRRMNASSAEAWKKLIDTIALNTAFAAQNDTSLSESGKFADAAAVGAAIATCFKYVAYTPSSASDVLTRFEAYTCCLAAASDWADAPVSSGTGMILTIKNAVGNYGLQLWISSTPASSDPGYFGIYIRRYSSGSWTNWFSLVDSTLTQAGFAADAKATGDRISEAAFKTTGKYYAFGDSLVKAQIGRWSGPTQYSTKGYVDTTAKILHMPFNNQAVGGQGLIKDWALIIDTINALDMSDACLITVGWSGNDSAVWRLPSCAMGTYTDVTTVDVTDTDDVKSLVTYESGVPVSVSTTVMGFYYTIMKLLQTKCPKAQIVLVSGYGTPSGNSSQHILAQLTEQFTHMTTYGTGGNHTTKERYDELEKMANIHGWPCVNQAKGCCFNEFNAPYVFGDQAHPTDEGYAMYGNSLANRIAAFYANRDV